MDMHDPEVRYWHGLGLCMNPNDVVEIKPRSALEDPLALVGVGEALCHDASEYVFASTSKEVALAFSVLSRGSTVCEVSPGFLAPQPDPDFPSLGVQFRGSVKVLSKEFVDRKALPNSRQVVKILAPDTLSSTGQHWHHKDGRLQPPPLWRAWGYEEADFDWLGPWFPWQCVFQDPKVKRVYAITNTFQKFWVWPTALSLPPGTFRRKPSGTLVDSWTSAGDVPDPEQLEIYGLRGPIIDPWDW